MKTMLAVLMLFAWTVANAVEYKVIRLRFTNTTEDRQTEILNAQAKEGWRLVEVYGVGNTVVDLYLVRQENKP